MKMEEMIELHIVIMILRQEKISFKKLENIGAKVYTDFAGNLIAIYNPSNSNLKTYFIRISYRCCSKRRSL